MVVLFLLFLFHLNSASKVIQKGIGFGNPLKFESIIYKFTEKLLVWTGNGVYEHFIFDLLLMKRNKPQGTV